jgi:hypothetical protein
MNIPLLSKLATVAAALMLNGLIIAGVNYLCNVQMHQYAPEIVLARASGGRADAVQASVAIPSGFSEGIRMSV